MTPTRRQSRSESVEDHLERIQELVDRVGYARVSDLADELKLSRSTVSNMVQRLAKRGYVNYQRYRGFTLTEAGRMVAADIKTRHHTLTAFLHQLGLEADTINAEVEEIEHHLKPQTLAALSSLVAYWQEHPTALSTYRKFHSAKAKAKVPGSKFW